LTDRQPGTAIGRYQIRSIIGRGGLATVYSCWDTLLDRDVAIKVFSSRATSKDLLRIQEAEARLAAKLNHHALTTLYDAGVEATNPDEPQIYLVMEHIAGADLKSWIESRRLDALQLSYLGTDLNSALQYVHENGFLHCDIKPANVLIAERDANSRLRGKLTDFGIAGIIGAQKGQGTTTGTAAYLAPEQVEGGDPTPATDVYALGLVLIEAYTGRLEFPGSVQETALERLRRDPRLPSDMPSDLADALRAMVERDPAKRTSAHAASERFERVAARLIAKKKGAVAPMNGTSEDDRLAAVHRYGVLDTPPDEAFDRITRIAGRMLDSPISFVSIVDEDRVFHKARLGVDIAEVPRADSLCPITVDVGVPWYVADISVDERTKDNALLAQHGVRAYAAAPMVTEDGHTIGSLCVYDVRPRTFTPEDLEDLNELAAVAMHELELRLAARRAAFGA
jgi:tRNA A-37 threonylcarbamoyl transferase component Bud32